MICDDFKIKDRIKNLSKSILANLNKNENNDIHLYLYSEKYVE